MPRPHLLLSFILWTLLSQYTSAQELSVDGIHRCGTSGKKLTKIACGLLDPDTDQILTEEDGQCLVKRTQFTCCDGWSGPKCLTQASTLTTQFGSTVETSTLLPTTKIGSNSANESAPTQCSLIGGQVLQLDGVHFKFPGHGMYHFAVDDDDVDPLFDILVQTNVACREGTDTNCYSVYIRMFGVDIVLRPGGKVLVNDNEINKISHFTDEEQISISRQGIFTSIRAYNDIEILFDHGRLLTVHIPPDLRQIVRGLCFPMILDGTHLIDPISTERMSVAEFINRMAVDNTTEEITEVADPCNGMDIKSEAESKCQFLLEDEMFLAAGVVINIETYYKMCVAEVCSCIQYGGSTCQACDVIEHFSYTSNNNGVALRNWRSENLCPYDCPGTKIFKECNYCIKTCVNVDSDECSDKCVPGCVCPEGQYLNGDECVEVAECPCTAHGSTYPAGKEIQQGCNTCTCTGGKWRCTEKKCPGECTMFGSGAFITFDGNSFDTRRQCLYNLASSTKFYIHVDNRGCTNTSNSNCLREVVIKYGSVKYIVGPNAEVFRRGQKVFLPETIDNCHISDHGGHMVHFIGEFDLEVFVSMKLSRVHVKLGIQLENKVTGICGNFNGDDKDDFFTPGGQFNNHALFLEDSVIQTPRGKCLEESAFAEPLNFNSQSQEYAAKVCQFIKSEVYSKCASVVSSTLYYEQCMKDVARGVIFGISNSMLSSYSAYSRICHMNHIGVDWHFATPYGPSCPAGTEWRTDCGTSHSLSCSDLTAPKSITYECIDGCFCFGDQVLDERTGQCVALSECPCKHNVDVFESGERRETPCGHCECTNGEWACTEDECSDGETDKCKNGKVWSNCVRCERKCSSPDPGCLEDEEEDCEEGCACPEGLAWEGEKCVPVKQCPCMHSGIRYHAGEGYESKCKNCMCTEEGWSCTKKPCTKTCRAWGDPHYETFDGKRYEFQGNCRYVLAEDCGTGQNIFKIVVENVPCGAGGMTCTKAILFSIKGFVIHMVGGAEISVQNKDSPNTDPSSVFRIRQEGIYKVVRTKFGVTLRWNLGTAVDVTLEPEFEGKVCGLCGNFNGLSSDDFVTSQGELEQVPNLFGHSWKVENCPMPPGPINPCDVNPERKKWAEFSCGIIKQGIFAQCHSSVEPERYYSDCVMDTCACDRGGDCGCLCTAIAAYTKECSETGVPIKWRSDGTCGLQCEEGKIYTECGSSCNSECYVEGSEEYGCEETCVEGCFCPPGQVEYEGRCITRGLCPCFADGELVPAGDVFCQDCQTCHCSPGGFIQCRGPTCAEKEEADECQCDAGFLSCDEECSGCFTPTERCDGIDHCDNGKDEQNCKCQFNNETKEDGSQWEGSLHCIQCTCTAGSTECKKKCDLRCGEGMTLILHEECDDKCCECVEET